MINITDDDLNSTFFKRLGVTVPTRIINNAVEDFSDICISRVPDCYHELMGKRFFLDVANFNERKNQLMLIKAYDEFYRLTQSDVHLVLIGGTVGNDGYEYVSECKRLIADLKCSDQIHVLENINRQDTKQFIKNCYCATMTSTYEVYPIFLAEAIVCAHPFISTDVGSVKQIEGGLIAMDFHDYVMQMVRIVDDKELYNSLVDKGKAYAEKHFRQDEKVNELEDLIFN